MKKYIFVLSFGLGLVACSSKTVNPDYNTTLLPAAVGAGTNEDIQSAMKAKSSAAIQGRVAVNNDTLPSFVGGVTLALYQKNNAGAKEISRFTSEVDGSFVITRKLLRGKYEIRSVDPRYEGMVSVNLEDHPVTDLIVPVKKK